MHDLLDRFDRCFRQVKYEQRALTFGDLTTFMIEAQRLGRIDEICFRIDAQLRHLLLDEFQDTSRPQWRALEPLAKEIVSDGLSERTIFCVGDVKQSIYVWRGAAPELLPALPTLLGGSAGAELIAVTKLAESRRSAPPIIETVNRVFGNLESNPALSGYDEAVRAWTSGYQTHTTVRTFEAGYVELRTVPRLQKGPKPDRNGRFRQAADVVAELYRADPHRTVGVLLRKNESVGRLLYELGPARLGIPASGRGGGSLTDAAAVNAVLDLLRLADHPDDTAAAFHVQRSPLGSVVGLPPAPALSIDARRAVSRRLRQTLLDSGYASTLQEWISGIVEHVDRREVQRLRQLLELAERFDEAPSLRPGDFVRQATEVAVDDLASSSVRVMSMHQSKGLEFDVVVLPELDWSLGRTQNELVAVERREPAGEVTRIVRWPAKDVRTALPALDPIVEQHGSRLLRDELSLLYVALTRARRGLFMFIDEPAGEGKATRRADDLLRESLGGSGGTEVVYQAGDRAALDLARSAATSLEPPVPTRPPRRALRPTRSTARLATAAPSASHVRPSLGSALECADRTAFDRGTAIHRLFEQVQWIEEFVPDEASLVQLARAAAPAPRCGLAHDQVRNFLRMLANPIVRASLARPEGRDGSTAIVWRERPYARLTSGLLEQGTIDRLVIESFLGRPIRAHLIDFKTDEVAAEAVPRRAELYRHQLEAYRDAAAEQLGLDAAKIAPTLLFVTPAVAITLE